MKLALFERGIDKGTVVTQRTLGQPGQVAPHQLKEPLLIKSFEDANMASICSMCHAFTDKFSKSKLRKTDGRAETVVKGENKDVSIATFKTVMAAGQHLDFDKMHPELQPAVFGICKGMETVSCERARAATLRIHAQGGRQLVMASSWALKDFMEKNGITQLGPDNLRDLFKGMSKETIDAFIGAGHKLYHTKVMPNEGILLPFNWVFAEKIHHNNDVLGLRITFWLKDDETDITAASRWLISMKKTKLYAPERAGCVG